MSTIPDLPEAYGASRHPYPAPAHVTVPSAYGAPSHHGDRPDPARPVEAAVVSPAGTYWLGDVALLLSIDQWALVLGMTGEFCHAPVASLDIAGSSVEIIALNASNGPGTYLDGQGRAFHTDSGLIGLVSGSALELLDPDEVEAAHGLGAFVDFSAPTLVRDDAGILCFGDYQIDTTETDALGPRCVCGRLLVTGADRMTRARRTEATARLTGTLCSTCEREPRRVCCTHSPAYRPGDQVCGPPPRPQPTDIAGEEPVRASRGGSSMRRGQPTAQFWSTLAHK